jgi:hypothetical protein
VPAYLVTERDARYSHPPNSTEMLLVELPPQRRMTKAAIPNPAQIDELSERLNLLAKIVAAQRAVFGRMRHAPHSSRFRYASLASRAGCVCCSFAQCPAVVFTHKPRKAGRSWKQMRKRLPTYCCV